MSRIMGRQRAMLKSDFTKQEACVAYPRPCFLSKALFSHSHSIFLGHHLITSLSKTLNSYSFPKRIQTSNPAIQDCHSLIPNSLSCDVGSSVLYEPNTSAKLIYSNITYTSSSLFLIPILFFAWHIPCQAPLLILLGSTQMPPPPWNPS